MASDLEVRQKDIVTFVESKSVLERIRRALPHGTLTPQVLARIAISAMIKTPGLFHCTKESILEALLLSAELGLAPSGPLGLAYLIPYGSKCEFVVGYKGLVTLARRSAYVASITAEAVFEGDHFKYALGLNPVLEHIPYDMLIDPPGRTGEKLIAAYSVLTLKDGTKEFKVVTPSFIKKIRASSPGSKHPDSPWNQWEPSMWCKTAVKQVLKLAILSPDDQLAKAINTDDALEGTVDSAYVTTSEQPSSETKEKPSGTSGSMDTFVAQQQNGAPSQSPALTEGAPQTSAPAATKAKAGKDAKGGGAEQDPLRQPAKRQR